MVDDMFDYIKEIRSKQVWQKIPDKIASYFDSSVPYEGKSLEEVYSEFVKMILPYPMGNIHPRFWGWALGTGTITGSLAEFLSASINSNMGGGNHGAILVENQVINWIKELMGFQKSASGLLTSGCSAANLIGLLVARKTKVHYNIRKKGNQNITTPLIVYASSEIHSSIQKAVEIMGLGSDHLHLIPVTDKFEINLDALQTKIIEDRNSGYKPFCIVGGAGTINTGSFDELNELSKISRKENLWFHVDGAFGVWANLLPDFKKKLMGLNKADSIALDLHKWMYMPYEIGCVLIRNKLDHLQTFNLMPAYLSHDRSDGGLVGGNLPWYSDFGFQLSRGFRALKAWMSIKEYGIKKYSQLIQQNIDQANYLARLVEKKPNLELVAPVFLNIVCFRFFRSDVSAKIIDDLNKKIVIELQENGIAVLSWTLLNNQCVMRAAIFNHRSLAKDFDVLVIKIVEIGNKLVSKLNS
jgi:glutamate/tyrosine decarboxylase-like PLP-dependent enzyme